MLGIQFNLWACEDLRIQGPGFGVVRVWGFRIQGPGVWGSELRCDEKADRSL